MMEKILLDDIKKEKHIKIVDSLSLDRNELERFKGLVNEIKNISFEGDVFLIDDRDVSIDGKISFSYTKTKNDNFKNSIININEFYASDAAKIKDFNFSEMVFEITNDEISIQDMVIDNILIFLDSNESISEEKNLEEGESWKLMSEEDFLSLPNEDEKKSPFDKLKKDFE